MKKGTTVIALGGNALVKKGQQQTITHQIKNIDHVMQQLLPILKQDKVIITHGSGPQVGMHLLLHEQGNKQTTLDVLDAEIQGQLGYLIEQSCQNVLMKHRIKKPVVSLLTQIIVNKNDPAFKHPTKPIGPFYSKQQAAKKRFHMVYQKKKGWRRVVPSPQPQSIDDVNIIKKLIKEAIVIAAGGGGIPVIKHKGKLKGVSAVIDKDLAAAVLAHNVKADLLLILTDVKKVSLNYRKRNEQTLKKLTIKQAQQYLKQKQFPPGSMGPKIQASINFLKKGGKKVIITSPSCISQALKGKEGTTITKR